MKYWTLDRRKNMAFIHTIKLTNEKRIANTVSSTRKSENRKYQACIVSTTTARSLEINAAKKADVEKKLAEDKLLVESLVTKFGMTPEQAEQKHKEESDAWFKGTKDGEGFFETSKRIREEMNFRGMRTESHDIGIVTDMVRRGYANPFDRTGFYGLVEAHCKAQAGERALQNWSTPVLGSEAVLSWHGTVDLAQKAMGGYSWAIALGDKLTIRTDIEVTETKKRAKAG